MLYNGEFVIINLMVCGSMLVLASERYVQECYVGRLVVILLPGNTHSLHMAQFL